MSSHHVVMSSPQVLGLPVTPLGTIWREILKPRFTMTEVKLLSLQSMAVTPHVHQASRTTLPRTEVPFCICENCGRPNAPVLVLCVILAPHQQRGGDIVVLTTLPQQEVPLLSVMLLTSEFSVTCLDLL